MPLIKEILLFIHQKPFLASFAMTFAGLILIGCVALAARALSPPVENLSWDVESDEIESARNSPVEGRPNRWPEGWRAYMLIDDGIVPVLSESGEEQTLTSPDRARLQLVLLDQHARRTLGSYPSRPDHAVVGLDDPVAEKQ